MPRVESDLIAAEITPRGGKEREVARALQAMDFRVHAVGATISVDAPRERWKAVFAARFAPVHRHREKRRTPGAAAPAQHVSPVVFQVPLIYPGRHVPDVCGLVGMQPGALYIMLPVPPGSAIDVGVSGGAHPNGDEPASNDGWAAISGTSAASPQIAGVCAQLKQVQLGLSPKLAKAVLRASARDVTNGASGNGQPAGPGHDGATGAGLVNATAAYELARSVQTRQLFTLPPPR